MSLTNNNAATSSGRSRPTTINDVFGSIEREMLAPWGLASRFPTARDMFPTFPSSLFGDGSRSLDMSLDFHETKDGFELIADLPGMKKEDVSIDVDQESGVLTVSGERKSEKEEKGDGKDGDRKYHFVERSYGKTSRSVRLPEAADTATANADLTDGVLTITFPKKEAPVSSRFQIPLGGGSGVGGGSGDGKVSIKGDAAATDGDTGS
ncbi:unnamed protein product [Ectocarpus sp. 6 AP-2014]